MGSPINILIDLNRMLVLKEGWVPIRATSRASIESMPVIDCPWVSVEVLLRDKEMVDHGLSGNINPPTSRESITQSKV